MLVQHATGGWIFTMRSQSELCRGGEIKATPNPREKTGFTIHACKHIHGDLLWVDMGVQGADPDTAAEIIRALVDHHDPWDMHDFEEAPKAELEELDTAYQILEMWTGG